MRNKLVPYPIIEEAAQGDPDALQTVVSHYGPYIHKLSIRCGRDKHGNLHPYLDDPLRQELEGELMMKILLFDPDRT